MKDSASQPSAKPPVKRSSRRAGHRRWWIWRLAALLFPFFVVLAVELALRAIDFAPPPALFLHFEASGAPDRAHTNRDYARQFFFRYYRGQPVAHSEPVDEHLTLPKPPGLLRVVFVGASTVEGFPHTHNLAASRFLEAMLSDMIEDQQVEVLNLGFSALASFPLIQLARDSLRAEPDLAVVYTGHNEFYGAYGVASLQTAFTGRTGMKLHAALRRVRVLTGLRSWIDRSSNPRAAVREDLIDIMPAGVLDGPDDARYGLATANLRGNLVDIFSVFRRAGVAAVACSLVCNEADVAPFASAPVEHHLPAAQANEWRRLYEQGEAMRNSDPAAALEQLQAARAIFAEHAGLEYALARLYLRQGNTRTARRLFQSAVDHDLMPWRAGPRSNEAVREAATQTNVTLADVEAGFERYGNGRPIGWDLMSDHLHPSVEGQALLARIVAEAIATNQLLAKLTAADLKKLRTLSEYRSELGDDPLIELATTVRMVRLFTDSPLARNNERAARRLSRHVRRLFRELAPSIQSIAAPYLGPNGQPLAPLPRHIALAAAQELNARGVLDQAAHYYRIASLSAEPYTFERLEALAGWLASRHLTDKAVDQATVEAALTEGRVIIGRTRRAGGHWPMAQLSALAGDRDAAFGHVQRNWRGLTDRARREMIATVLRLLDHAPTIAPTRQQVDRVFQELRSDPSPSRTAR